MESSVAPSARQVFLLREDVASKMSAPSAPRFTPPPHICNPEGLSKGSGAGGTWGNPLWGNLVAGPAHSLRRNACSHMVAEQHNTKVSPAAAADAVAGNTRSPTGSGSLFRVADPLLATPFGGRGGAWIPAEKLLGALRAQFLYSFHWGTPGKISARCVRQEIPKTWKCDFPRA